MKGDPKTNAKLNGVLRILLTGINQYFLHSRMCGNWGMDSLKKKDYDYSIYLMKAADRIINRILFLEGLPNLQDLGKIYLGEDVPQIFAGNLKLDTELRGELQATIAYCEENADFISRELCESILHECEEQIDWLEAQQYLIDHSGLQNYIQSAV